MTGIRSSIGSAVASGANDQFWQRRDLTVLAGARSADSMCRVFNDRVLVSDLGKFAIIFSFANRIASGEVGQQESSPRATSNSTVSECACWNR